jgi:hypothetical protein
LNYEKLQSSILSLIRALIRNFQPEKSGKNKNKIPAERVLLLICVREVEDAHTDVFYALRHDDPRKKSKFVESAAKAGLARQAPIIIH